MERIKTGFTVTAGIVGGSAVSALGGWDAGLQTLVTVMVIDFITGFMVATVFRKSTKTPSGAATSMACWKGLCKKSMTMFLILIAYRLDVLAGTTIVRNATIVGYIINETLSVIENAGQMGLFVPSAIRKSIDVLDDRENNK